jgi:hypothetical protein
MGVAQQDVEEWRMPKLPHMDQAHGDRDEKRRDRVTAKTPDRHLRGDFMGVLAVCYYDCGLKLLYRGSAEAMVHELVHS